MPAFSSVGRARRGRILAVAGASCLVVLAVTLSYITVPLANTTGDHFDALLVLGSPATFEGRAGKEQQYRVDEAVREYQRGRASHIVMSGGAAANRFVEAHIMAQSAEQLGVPASAIVEEAQSLDTYENIQNSQRIFDAQGWQRVEVISSRQHLHRAAVLLQMTSLQWQTHPAPSPGRSVFKNVQMTVEEAVAVTLLRCFGLKMRPIIHVFGVTQEKISYTFRWLRYSLPDLLAGRRPSIPYHLNSR